MVADRVVGENYCNSSERAYSSISVIVVIAPMNLLLTVSSIATLSFVAILKEWLVNALLTLCRRSLPAFLWIFVVLYTMGNCTRAGRNMV